MTLAIAIWGAVVSTLVLLIQVVRFRRERTRLRVSAGSALGEGGARISIRVVNPPLAPAVTVMRAGLFSVVTTTLEGVEDKHGNKLDGETEKVRLAFLFHDGDPILLNEGETKVFEVTLQSMPIPIAEGGDEEFRSFAVDAEGRVVRGNKSKFFMEPLERGWEPDPPAPDHTFRTSTFILEPEGRWARLRWRRKYR